MAQGEYIFHCDSDDFVEPDMLETLYTEAVMHRLDRDRKMVQPYVDCLCREVEEIRIQADKAGLELCSIYIGGGTPTSLSADQLRQLMGTVLSLIHISTAAIRPTCSRAVTATSVLPVFSSPSFAHSGCRSSACQRRACSSRYTAVSYTHLQVCFRYFDPA